MTIPSKRKLIPITLFLILLISIPLGLYLSKQAQTGRSRASENNSQRSTVQAQVKLDSRLIVTDYDGDYPNWTDDFLVRGAQDAQDLGFQGLEISMGPANCNGNGLEEMMHTEVGLCNPSVSSLEDIARIGRYQQVFNMPFKTYVITATPLTTTPTVPNYQGLQNPRLWDEVQRDTYRLARYLLETYRNTNKTFILQDTNEMDWQLLPQPLHEDYVLTDYAVQNAIDFWNAYQRGIDDAKRDVGTQGVRIYHGCELNHVMKAIYGSEGNQWANPARPADPNNRKTVVNNVVPGTNCDLYGYSSYDSFLRENTKGGKDKMVEALNHIESKLSSQTKNKNPELTKKVYISEIGIPENKPDYVGTPQNAINTLKTVVGKALDWGVPYLMYWQLYDNECTARPATQPNQCNGYWIRKPSSNPGEKGELSEQYKQIFLSYQVPADPTSFRAQCSSDGRSATLTWEGQGAEKFNVRVTDGVNDQKNPANNCGTVNLSTCLNDVTQTTLTVPVVPGRNNSWWMEAGKNGRYTDSVGGPNFTCNADGSGGASPTPGSSSNPGNIIQNIINLFGGAGNQGNGDQNGDGKLNELDFGAVYSK